MTIQENIKQDTFYIGQAIKAPGSGINDHGYIVDVKPETASLSVMGFGGAAFKTINYKMVIVWTGNKNVIQHNANEHDILHLKGVGDISESEALLLLIDAEQEQQKTNDYEAQKKEAERVEFNLEIEKLLSDPENSHLINNEAGQGGGKFVAGNIRKQLKKYFPGVKFSVKSSYTSVNVRWTDGPTDKAVDEKIQRFSNGGFDGYTDYHYTKNSPFNNAFGGVQFLFTDRDLSDELIQQAINQAVKGWGETENVTLENYKNGNLYYNRDAGNNCPADWSKEIREQINLIDLTPAAPVKAIKAPSKAEGVTIEEHTHTKKGFQMWIVILSGRVERSVFISLREQAKVFQGWYSRKWGTAPAGFAFKSLEDAEKFVSLCLGGDTPPEGPKPDKADKLRSIADNMQSAIDNKLGDRLTNTPKRQAEAGRARHEGEKLQRTQTVLNKLADLHEAGEVPALVANITTKKAVYDLMGSVIERNGAYYCPGVDTGKPSNTSPEALALWEFLTPKSSEELKKEDLERKIDELQFANIPGYFPTPERVVDLMLNLVNITDGERVLEPEAGSGAICDLIKLNHPGAYIQAYEKQHSLREILTLKDIDLIGSDFLEAEIYNQYDVVMMNPPFENQADIKHVLHAYNALKPGGRLAAVMSPGPFFNSNSLAESFRQWFEKYDGYKIDLEPGSFKASGTNVNTILIYLEK
tara:strand:+ start:28 stop:2118 length:2091 start_codon:yes stop_codon:yes gene_type:complete